MTLQQILLCAFVAISLAGGQVLFKFAAMAWNRAAAAGTPWSFLFSPALIAVLSLYAISAFAYMFALRTVPLSRAYVFALTGSALVPLMAWAIFGESLSVRYAVGFSLILVGLYLCLGFETAAR